MKNTLQLFLMAMIVFAVSCDREEIADEVEQETMATTLNSRVMNCRFEPIGVSTVTGYKSGYQDGTLDNALLGTPIGLVVDERRQIMYVADWTNNCIRAIKGNKMTTFVGGVQGDREGQGSNARLNGPSGITIDKNGNIYVADRGNHKIRKITPEGYMSTFAGSTLGYANGRGTNAKFSYPFGITIDLNGVLYVTDEGNSKIRTVKSDRSVGFLAGSNLGFRDSNNPYEAQFSYPRGIAIGPDDAIYVADYINHRIRRVERRGGSTSTFAGSRAGNSNGTRYRSTFKYPEGIACDKAGNFFVVDSNNHQIRFISGNEVGTLAGSRGGNIDGAYNEARFQYPRGITIYKDNLFIADSRNHSIREITMGYSCN